MSPYPTPTLARAGVRDKQLIPVFTRSLRAQIVAVWSRKSPLFAPVSRQFVAHNRAWGHPARNRFEPGAGEGRGIAGARCARCQLRIKGIGFKRGRLRAPCRTQSRSDQCLRDALPPITLAYIKAGERPDRRIVHPLCKSEVLGQTETNTCMQEPRPSGSSSDSLLEEAVRSELVSETQFPC